MALVRWSYGDEEEKQREVAQNPSVGQVQSVQSTWQPTQSDNGSPSSPQTDNYLMSEEKAQADHQLYQRRAAEAEARRQAAIQAQAERAQAQAIAQENSRVAAAQQAQAARRAETSVDRAKNDNGWRKYYDDSLRKQKAGLNFWGRLLDNGQASRRAEIDARVRHSNKLLERAYDDQGNTRDQRAADRASNLAQYNVNLARNNYLQGRAITNSIGAGAENRDRNIADRLKSTVNATRHMSIYDGLTGVNDATRMSPDDVGRFLGNLGQGIFTMPLTGAKELIESLMGRGTNYDTGLQDDLSGTQRLGRAVSGSINVASPFLTGGGAKLTNELFGVATGRVAATAAQQQTARQILGQIARASGSGALTQGALGAAQSTGEYVGDGRSILDDKGNVDMDELSRFVQQVGIATATSAGGGALIAGGGRALNSARGGRSRIPELTVDELRALEELPRNEFNGEPQTQTQSQAQQQPADGTPMATNDAPPSQPQYTPAPIETPPADGVPTPVTPEPVTPATPEPVTDSTLTPVDTPVDTPAEAADIETPTPIREVVQPEPANPVADGVPAPRPVPTSDPSTPMVRAEEVRRLQESRAGTTQAEEAAINRRLQEVESELPRITAYHGSTNNALEELLPGARTGLNERRNLTYLAEDAKTAANYAKVRGTDGNGLGELQDSPTGRVYDVDVEGEILGAYDFDKLAKLANAPGAEKLGRARNHLTNPTGLSADILENNPGLVEFLRDNGVTAVRAHLMNGGGSELIVLNPERARLAGGKNTSRTADDDLDDIDARLERGEIDFDEHARLEDEIFARESAEGRMIAEDGSSNLPDDMGAPTRDAVPAGENYLQRTVSSDASTKDVRRRLTGVSEVKDTENLDEILDNIPKMTPKMKERIQGNYNTVEAAEKRINQIQKRFREGLSAENTQNVPMDEARALSHERNRLVQDMQIAEKNLQSTIRRLEGRQSVRQRTLNSASNLVSFQQGNMLASLPVQEKNIVGDIIATVTHSVRHPSQMATNIPEARLGSEMKKAVREAGQVLPQTLSEVPRYLVRTALSPVYAINNSMANVRGGVYRNELAKAELVKAGVTNPTKEQIDLQAMRAGNAREIVVNLNKNVGATIADPYKAAKASDEYFKVLENSTSHKELAQFAENTRASSGILQELIRPSTNGGKVTPMSLLINTLYPFTNPAINASKKAIYQLDPRKASQVNEIRKIIQSPTQQNMAKLAKMAGTATSIAAIVTLLEDGVIDYNDDEISGDVSRPRGWSIKVGENTYMPVRAFGVFEPFIVATGVTHKVMSGEIDNPADAMAMAASSLPVMSSNEFYSQAAREWGEGEMWGYGTQSQVVSRTKNLVPFVNNGLGRWMDRNQGNSSNATSAYVSKENEEGETVPDFLPWLGNSIRAGFGDTSGLKPSYTPAGQVRTADNQGAFVNKRINDASTAEYNETISNLVKYARETDLGSGSRDMFNTYPGDKGNHFSSIQSGIWAITGKESNETKLKPNDKLGDLATQIRDGFFGDGDELLTLDGQNLYSGVEMPNARDSRNSSRPISMKAIRNAVASSGLPEDQRDRMNELGRQASELYGRAQSGEISWDQRAQISAEIAAEERSILANSEGYRRMESLMTTLEQEGFFEKGGLGSTRSGQTYLWNALNSLIGTKGKTPAAEYPKDSKGWTPWGRRGGGGRGGSRGPGFGNTIKPTNTGVEGIKWTPVGKRQMRDVKTGRFIPVDTKVTLNNAVKRDKTLNYADRTF